MCTFLTFISFFLIFKFASILWRWINFIRTEAVQFDVVGFFCFFCFFYFSDSTSTSTSSSMKLHRSFRICLQYGCWFGGKLIQKLRQKDIDEESCVKTCKKDTVVVSSPAVDELVDATVNTEDVNVGQTPTSPTVNPKSSTSYANLFTTGPSRKVLNFRTLFNPEGNGVDVVVPVESVRAICARVANTVSGFFLGKHVAYPVVANYVQNTWG
ncbi:hypothetical protein Tco_1380804, partial [Tanacetum coccineum]